MDAAGNTRRREYNEAGQIIRETDCSGRITRYRFYPLGWLQSVKAPDGEETRYHYDAAGRPLQLERAEGWQESIGWNSRGLPEYHITPDGKRHEFSWDDAGRLVATRNALGKRCAVAGTAATD